MPTRSGFSEQFGPVPPWLLQLLGVLLGLFVVELVLRNQGLPVEVAQWASFGSGFQPWQLLTRFLVQGRESLSQVLFGLIFLFFLLPTLRSDLGDKLLLGGLGAGMLGATALPLVLDAVGLVRPSIANGWQPALLSLLVLFALRRPDAVLLLFFVIPAPARALLWGSLGLSLLVVLAAPGIGALQYPGAWLGTYAWWMLMGPGKRRRKLVKDATRIEKELHKFTVYEGGKNRPDDDEFVH